MWLLSIRKNGSPGDGFVFKKINSHPLLKVLSINLSSLSRNQGILVGPLSCNDWGYMLCLLVAKWKPGVYWCQLHLHRQLLSPMFLSEVGWSAEVTSSMCPVFLMATTFGGTWTVVRAVSCVLNMPWREKSCFAVRFSILVQNSFNVCLLKLVHLTILVSSGILIDSCRLRVNLWFQSLPALCVCSQLWGTFNLFVTA